MERFEETRNIIKAFMNEEELIADSIDNITTSIEDIIIAGIGSSAFSDDSIAIYAQNTSKKIVIDIITYLKNNNIQTFIIKDSLENMLNGWKKNTNKRRG